MLFISLNLLINLLQARLNSSAEVLLEELFYRIENVPKWNPTLLESKILKVFKFVNLSI